MVFANHVQYQSGRQVDSRAHSCRGLPQSRLPELIPVHFGINPGFTLKVPGYMHGLTTILITQNGES